MNDPVSVGIADRLTDGLEDRQIVDLACLDQRVKRLTSNQLHGEKGPAVANRANLMYRRNAGMLKLTRNPRFLIEARNRCRIIGHPLLQDFDGDFPLQTQIAGAINLTHAAPGDEVEDLVARNWW